MEITSWKGSSRLKPAVRWLGVVTSIGMFAVLLSGTRVTSTGSEQGCGHSWPLCHGQFIPQFAVATAIEFTHRVIVGIESILVLALAVGVLILYRHRREILFLASLMVFSLFLQAGLGAWAVMYPQEAAIIALHFGVSLISFSSVLLTTIVLFEADDERHLRSVAIPTIFRWTVWGITVYTYMVVYLGAYVRHAGADLACRDWPLCNGRAVPALHGSVTAAFAHRIAAAVLGVAIVILLVWAARHRARRSDLFRASVVASVMIGVQILSGAYVVHAGVDLFSALAHAASAGLLFASLSYLCLHVLPEPAHRRATAPVTLTAASGAHH